MQTTMNAPAAKGVAGASTLGQRRGLPSRQFSTAPLAAPYRAVRRSAARQHVVKAEKVGDNLEEFRR